MTTYSLAGVGIQALSGGVTSLYVVVTTFNPNASNGRANPANWYDLGLLRLGASGFYLPEIPIDAPNQLVQVPAGSDSLGYSLFGGTTINATENGPPTPPGPATISTTLDGGSSHDGDPVSITFARTDTPDVSDYVGIVDETWLISYGQAFGYFQDTASASFFPYTSSESDSPGGTPVASGTFAGTILSPFGIAATLYAVYVDGATNTVIATGGTFSFS